MSVQHGGGIETHLNPVCAPEDDVMIESHQQRRWWSHIMVQLQSVTLFRLDSKISCDATEGWSHGGNMLDSKLKMKFHYFSVDQSLEWPSDQHAGKHADSKAGKAQSKIKDKKWGKKTIFLLIFICPGLKLRESSTRQGYAIIWNFRKYWDMTHLTTATVCSGDFKQCAFYFF